MEENEVTAIVIKRPSKILHFSDGVLEIFDDEEEIKKEIKEEIVEVDEKQLNWTPWLLYKAQRIGQNVVRGLDYSGEKLADLIGITSPKYAYEIKQYQKELARKAVEVETEKQNTWTVEPAAQGPITTPPTQSTDPKF